MKKTYTPPRPMTASETHDAVKTMNERRLQFKESSKRQAIVLKRRKEMGRVQPKGKGEEQMNSKRSIEYIKINDEVYVAVRRLAEIKSLIRIESIISSSELEYERMISQMKFYALNFTKEGLIDLETFWKYLESCPDRCVFKNDERFRKLKEDIECLSSVKGKEKL